MKIAVIGNCQARPVAEILRVRSSDVEIIGTIIVHLSEPAESEAHYAMLDQADVIFAQAIHAPYRVSHVITDNLRSRFGDKVVSWPNVFFRGQCPDLAYIRSSTGVAILSPLREYSIRRIFSSWAMRQSEDECQHALGKEDAEQASKFRDIYRESLRVLRQRETVLDTMISDVIEEEGHARRLFFTFNHPTSYLLTRMAERLLHRVGRTLDLPAPEGAGEPLDLVVGPTFLTERNALSLPPTMRMACTGVEILASGNGATMGVRRDYDVPGLIKASYGAYDLQAPLTLDASFSPL